MEGTRSVPNLLNINQRKHEVFPTLLQGGRLFCPSIISTVVISSQLYFFSYLIRVFFKLGKISAPSLKKQLSIKGKKIQRSPEKTTLLEHQEQKSQGGTVSKNFKIERKSLALLKGSSKIFKIERKAQAYRSGAQDVGRGGGNCPTPGTHPGGLIVHGDPNCSRGTKGSRGTNGSRGN